MDSITVAGRVIGTASTSNMQCVVCGWAPKPGADKMHVVLIPRDNVSDWFLPVHDGCLATDYATFGSIVAIVLGALDESKF